MVANTQTSTTEIPEESFRPLEVVTDLPDLVIPDSTVDTYNSDIKEPENYKGTVVHTDGVIMSDGLTYAVVRTEPADPRTNVSLGISSALSTGPRGHNKRTLLHFANLGIPGVLVAGEGSYRPDSERFSNDPLGWILAKAKLFGPLGAISLTRSAHNFHQILDRLDDESPAETRHMVALGESRGAVVSGMGALAQAHAHDRNFIYADITAAPFPSAFEINDVRNIAGQGRHEPKALLQAGLSLTTRRIVHYPETIDPHIVAVVANIAMLPALMSGEAGHLGRQVPEDQNMHLLAYDKDWLSMPRLWSAIFSGHPNVRIKSVSGGHATIANPSTLLHVEERLLSLFDEIDRKGGSTDARELDFSKVHLGDGETPPESNA